MSLIHEELENFNHFVEERLRSGKSDLSMDELYDLWRIQNPTPREREEDVAAVQAALDDMRTGDVGRPAGEVVSELRNDLGIVGEE